MTVFLRTAGALLLILAGAGGGFAATARIGTQQRQCHTFARLLAYLAELLEVQALAGPELLARAARHFPPAALWVQRSCQPYARQTACRMPFAERLPRHWPLPKNPRA